MLAIMKGRVVFTVLMGFLSGCSGLGPQVNDRFTVFTPEFADNRVYYLGGREDGKNQSLVSLGQISVKGNNEIVRNSPISVILRSVEIPAKYESDGKGGMKKGVVSEDADYAVILDLGVRADGSSTSLVVWYQRGVQPGQSLNFSNLLVYYEPRWDDRVAPFFRVRVMNVTKEKNEETRKALERAHNIAGSIGVMAKNPIVTPLIGISFTAAELVFANKENKMLLDYSVQLYSTSAAQQSGMELGTLKRGSYVVIGRPPEEARTFWRGPFSYEPESRLVFRGANMINVPTASLTVGTFDSVVPIGVVDRSNALTALLRSNGSGSTVEAIEDSIDRLSASVKAFAATEKIRTYRNKADVEAILIDMRDPKFQGRLGSEDVFFLLRAVSECFGVEKSFVTVKDASDFADAHEGEPCKGEAT